MHTDNLPKYTNAFRDHRSGKIRIYFRRRRMRVKLPGRVGTGEFNKAYDVALLASAGAAAITVRTEHLTPSAKSGTIAALIDMYYQSGPFLSASEATKERYKRDLERLRGQHGDGPVADLTVQHVDTILAREIEARGTASAKKLKQALLKLMRLAFKYRLRDDNPVRDADPVKHVEKSHEPWSDQECERFRAYWQPGTPQRTAFELAYHLGVRRSDLRRLGPQHLKGDCFVFTTVKNPVECIVPIDPALLPFLATTDLKPYCRNTRGQQWREEGITGLISKAARKAGLPEGRSIHGLRHTFGHRHAENGATAHELMTMMGHTTLQQVERYTKGSDRAKHAQNVITRMARSS